MSAALTAAIEGEQAAVYAYGLAGPRLAGADADLAAGGLAAHRQRVTLLRERLAATEAEAGPPAPGGYGVTAPADATAARALLGGVEMRLAAAYADLAAESATAARLEAVGWARECAVRGVAWGLAPEAFPGRGDSLS